MKEIDLSNFKTESENFANIELFLTVKSFNLQAIRKRYLESRKRSRSGSVKRRKPAQGGLVYAKIKNGQLSESKIIAKYQEARGIDFRNRQLAISSENKIYTFDIDQGQQTTIQHPWLSYIHTVKFNEKGDSILVASSGVDTILEFDLKSKQKTWEWNAWEAGINEGVNPATGEKHFLTRNKNIAEKYAEQNKDFILIENPQEDKLPTALRAAFINSAEYDQNGDILLTFFHDGALRRLDKTTTTMETILKGFDKPHGGLALDHGYLVTDTAGGRVIHQHNQEKIGYYFHNLAGKDSRLKNLEWLQTSHLCGNSIITIDSNRTSFVIFNPQSKSKMVVPYDPNWAVQDFIVIKNSKTRIIKAVQENL